MRYGIPAGICLSGLALMLWPGASALLLCTGWAVTFLCVCLPYRMQPWSSAGGAWTLWAVSVVTVAGIIVNCHYYINVWGHGYAASPVLMNLDHWSAWNNALVDIGRTDAVACPWPATGYGHFVGYILSVAGADITLPLLFNSFCTTATVALTGALAFRCSDGTDDARRRAATCAMVMAACMCYFIASGAILIKDCPLALSVALVAWAALAMRTGRNPLLPVLAVAFALFFTTYGRPNYLLVYAFAIALLSNYANARSRVFCIAAVVVITALWAWLQYTASASSIMHYIDVSMRTTGDGTDKSVQHNIYISMFGNYFGISWWQRIVMLPFTTAIQFLIPLPWNYDKYLLFGPFMALAHFSFCRYAAGGLVMYWIVRQLRAPRAPRLLMRLTAVGLCFYLGAALQYSGGVSRYGIPLVSLLIPCAAYAWCHYRRERLFRLWAVIFTATTIAALAVAYIFTT